MVLLVAEQRKTLHAADVNGGIGAFCTRYWGYVLWAFAQQILLQDFFLRRMLRLVARPGVAVLLAAGVFSVAHLPNPILTLVTFGWGVIACSLFLRYHNLYPLGLTHALLGITIAISVPGPMIRNMRVGLGYLSYVQHVSRCSICRSSRELCRGSLLSRDATCNRPRRAALSATRPTRPCPRTRG